MRNGIFGNITQVENRLFKEKGLKPRTFHKDYEESLKESLNVQLEKYQKSETFDEMGFSKILDSITQKKFDQADNLLKEKLIYTQRQ